MKEIALTRGYVAIVDDEDYEWLSNFKWHYSHKGYACTNSKTVNGKRKYILMHSLLMNCTGKESIDHINRIGTDNRKENLRICNHSDNCLNRGMRSDNNSGYKGISKKNNGYQAAIMFKGKRRYLGIFKDAQSAAMAYNVAAKNIHGEYACLNIID